jgi:hypothetical protein
MTPPISGALQFSPVSTVFTGNARAIVPVSLYATGLISKDGEMKGTALLQGEAVADSEFVDFVLKDAFKRLRPASIPPASNISQSPSMTCAAVSKSRGLTDTAVPSGSNVSSFIPASKTARSVVTLSMLVNLQRWRFVLSRTHWKGSPFKLISADQTAAG